MNEKEKKAIEDLKELSHYCSIRMLDLEDKNSDIWAGFVVDIQIIKNLIEKQEKTINEMAEYIKYRTGSCPLDLEDCEIKFCDSECSMKIINKCWIEYFTKKVGE